MGDHNANQDSPISDSLHPLVNMAIIGFVFVFVAAELFEGRARFRQRMDTGKCRTSRPLESAKYRHTFLGLRIDFRKGAGLICRNSRAVGL
jgi:hypothetical protein